MDMRDTRNPTTADPRVAPVGRDLRDDRVAAARDVPDVRTASERAALRQPDDERSLGDLIKELRDESTTLIRQELALARTEMTEKASKAGRNAAYTGVGAVMIYLGLLFGLIALSVGLALALVDAAGIHAWWISPLIVATIVGIIGCIITAKGISTLKEQSLVPEKTVQSLKEDKQWLQEKVTQ